MKGRRRDDGHDLPIDDFLASLGLTGAEAAAARAALEDAGLTNPRKQRIARAKLERATAVIDARFRRLCRDCAEAVGDVVLPVDPAACPRCSGSANARAVADMAEACAQGDVRRLLVVGGSPSTRQELARLVGSRLDLRLVDGTARTTRRAAAGDVAWADLVVVCGATELDHAVSNHYTRADGGTPVVVAGRRGIAAAAQAVSEHLARRAGRRRRTA